MKIKDLDHVKLLAIDNAREGISISDAKCPDNPLIFVNNGFCMMTGYLPEEVIGKNCRFLQRTHKKQASVKNIRQAIAHGLHVQEDIINYRKDGSEFWNRLSITPIHDEAGTLTHFIGIQEDITDRKRSEALELMLANQAIINKTTVVAEEKQRQEIGRELHDNVNQLLALTKLYLIRALNEEELRFDLLSKSKDIVSTALEEIQKLSRSMVGPSISKTFKESIADLLETIQVGVAFKIEFCYDNWIENYLTPSKQVILYRIIQEQMSNVIKHANPSIVKIQIRLEDNRAILSIKDDGIGFDTKMDGAGIGLKNMKNRAELESGDLVINSAPNSGCELIALLPL